MRTCTILIRSITRTPEYRDKGTNLIRSVARSVKVLVFKESHRTQ